MNVTINLSVISHLVFFTRGPCGQDSLIAGDKATNQCLSLSRPFSSTENISGSVFYYLSASEIWSEKRCGICCFRL